MNALIRRPSLWLYTDRSTTRGVSRMHRTLPVIMTLALFTGFAVPAPVASADVITLTNGVNSYAGAHDNAIYSENGDAADGGGDYLFSGQNNLGQNRRSLLSFDLTGLGLDNSNVVITNVTLTMTVTNTNSPTRDVSLFRLTSSWGEGSEDAGGAEGQGTAATTGTSTWTYRFYDTTQWTTPGGDIAGSASGTGSAPNSGAFSISGAGMVQDVQNWLANSSTNYGWALIGDENTPGSAIKYVSGNNNEGYDLTDRPTLTIEYRVVPTPGAIVPMLFAGIGGLGLTGTGRKRGADNHSNN